MKIWKKVLIGFVMSMAAAAALLILLPKSPYIASIPGTAFIAYVCLLTYKASRN
ncbi:hypothetical protein JOD47_000714 [Arthrobacter tumbae]|nr:hypothetical protein [Arthrobacter tumbae]